MFGVALLGENSYIRYSFIAIPHELAKLYHEVEYSLNACEGTSTSRFLKYDGLSPNIS